MYSIHILRRAVKEIAVLPKDYAKLISEHIDRLAQNPRPPDAKKLQGTSAYSLRVGVYRVLYEIDDGAQTVSIYRVKHRKDVYNR
jgi:mRNA interferase RelE/StbE